MQNLYARLESKKRQHDWLSGKYHVSKITALKTNLAQTTTAKFISLQWQTKQRKQSSKELENEIDKLSRHFLRCPKIYTYSFWHITIYILYFLAKHG